MMVREIRIKVKTNSKRETVTALPDGRFEVAVQAKPEGGLANDRVRELLAEYFHVSLEHVRIVRGSTTPTKTVKITE